MGEEEEEGIGIISEGTLGLGELARLTVNNEAEAAYDVSHFCLYEHKKLSVAKKLKYLQQNWLYFMSNNSRKQRYVTTFSSG